MKLEWGTATEVNNSGFVVEHSLDGENFEPLGFVDGAGNANDLIEYQYIHSDPSLGVNYYRLRQEDFDGAFEYSDIIMVESGEFEVVAPVIYPNPVIENKLSIRLESFVPNSQVAVNLVDLLGKSHYQAARKAETVMDFELNNVPQGIYFLIIESGYNRYVHKVSVE